MFYTFKVTPSSTTQKTKNIFNEPPTLFNWGNLDYSVDILKLLKYCLKGITAYKCFSSCPFETMYRKLDKYLSDIKVAFQVISNDAVEFVCGEERGFRGFCGDLKKKKHPVIHDFV